MSGEQLIVFTAGCNGMKIYEFITLLQTHSIQTVIDTRRNTHYQGVREYGTHKLPAHLRDAEIAYRHELDLAPTKLIRDAFKNDYTQHAWQHFLEAYEHHIAHTDPLKNNPEFAQLIENSQRILLLCTEEHFEDCHRHVAAEYLKKNLPNVVIEHLMKHRPKRDEHKLRTRGVR